LPNGGPPIEAESLSSGGDEASDTMVRSNLAPSDEFFVASPTDHDHLPRGALDQG
jgi:hypothetical protein